MTHFTLRVAKKPVFAALMVALLFGAAEIAQRLSDWRKLAHRSQRVNLRATRAETTSGVPIGERVGSIGLRLDPYLLYRLAPGQHVDGMSINSLGFRGGEWSQAKSGRRIVLLGASTVFGFGVRDEQVFGAQLERMLAAEGRPAEVLNAGVPGYDATQELILLTTRLLDFAPDLVIVCDGWNDFYGAGLVSATRDYAPPFFYQMEELLEREQQGVAGLLRWSALYRGLERRVREWRQEARAASTSPFTGSDASVERYAHALERIVQVSRGAGAAVVLATQSEIFQRRGSVPESEAALRAKVEPGYAEFARRFYPRYVDAAARIAATLAVPHVDLTPLFDALPDPIFTDSCHLTPLGNQLVARRIVSTVP